MCYTLYMPIVCALQMVSRVFITILFAVEDLVRLAIHTVHTYISMVLQFCSILPMCFAYCFIKKCFTKGICSSGCTPKMGSCVYSGVTIVCTVVIILVFYYTYWIESFFLDIGLQPCKILSQIKQDACKFIDESKGNQTGTTLKTATTLQEKRPSNISQTKIKRFLDKYREIQSEDEDYFYDSTSNSIQEVVNALRRVNVKKDDRSNYIDIVPRHNATSQATSTPSIFISEYNYSSNMKEYHKHAIIDKLKRKKILEKGLKNELYFNGTNY